MLNESDLSFKKLNIAITADPTLPVPPKHYGGIERIIDMLAEGYTKQGHQVTLFAHKDSISKAKICYYPATSNSFLSTLRNTIFINKVIHKSQFDIIHSFSRLAYLLPSLIKETPKLMSYQREPTISQIKKACWIARKNSLTFTGCSDYISSQIIPFARAKTIYNGTDHNKYKFVENLNKSAPLIFLGRIEPIKGTHIAIEIALKTNRSLIISGNISAEHQTYYNQQIKPFLSEKIKYVGPVNDFQKSALLSSSSALLMPIQWNEPFGIVMIEAMACGTPVIAFNKGAVPEIIAHGKNGFYGNTVDELVAYVNQIDDISRKTVNQMFLNHFSGEIIVNKYLDLYHKLIK